MLFNNIIYKEKVFLRFFCFKAIILKLSEVKTGLSPFVENTFHFQPAPNAQNSVCRYVSYETRVT